MYCSIIGVINIVLLYFGFVVKELFFKNGRMFGGGIRWVFLWGCLSDGEICVYKNLMRIFIKFCFVVLWLK